ncbi:hypothetical protein HNY73_014184 [Argiope bruennichi]|uniref:Uncharacterized protein n=1 Tax=Argiope bruennichi TaxID=94029 RepID=A0A8T0ENG9_ARGBR|nr:hypothetical protein HNY73_014184 [Argiope bruennichi]
MAYDKFWGPGRLERPRATSMLFIGQGGCQLPLRDEYGATLKAKDVFQEWILVGIRHHFMKYSWVGVVELENTSGRLVHVKSCLALGRNAGSDPIVNAYRSPQANSSAKEKYSGISS